MLLYFGICGIVMIQLLAVRAVVLGEGRVEITGDWARRRSTGGYGSTGKRGGQVGEFSKECTGLTDSGYVLPLR
jgi:hypothetical protein